MSLDKIRLTHRQEHGGRGCPRQQYHPHRGLAVLARVGVVLPRNIERKRYSPQTSGIHIAVIVVISYVICGAVQAIHGMGHIAQGVVIQRLKTILTERRFRDRYKSLSRSLETDTM